MHASASVMRNLVASFPLSKDVCRGALVELCLAREALGSNLKLLEALIKGDRENEELLLMASEGFSAYALAFVEDDSAERAAQLYRRARDYALRILESDDAFAQGLRGDVASFKQSLSKLGADDVPAVFWSAFGWGSSINMSRTDPEAIADLPRVNAMMEFVAQRNRTYYYCGALVYLATMNGTLKKEGAILIVQGGCIESTGRNSATAEAMRSLLQELRSGQRELQSFSEPLRSVLQQHAVKRGNACEPFPRIDERVTRSFVLTPTGQEVAEQLSRDGVAEEVSQLTPELVKEGAWRTKRFRKYTISLRAPRIAAGKRHPYREFLDLVKLKLVSMGFQEMRGTLVETEFWNMDALFMPQFHPARDIHDVYL